MKLKVIYPGTFDPITNGHVDIIKRASVLFSELVIAVASNAGKQPLLPFSKRIELVKQVVTPLKHVEVVGFDGLLVDLVKAQQAQIILRSLRGNGSELEYELQLAGMNRQLCQKIETIFLTSSEEFMFISSTAIREIAALGGDIVPFVPPIVAKTLQDCCE